MLDILEVRVGQILAKSIVAIAKHNIISGVKSRI